MAAGLEEALARVDEVGPLVAKCADESERRGRLPDEVIDPDSPVI
jgi:hypothetical protein